MTRTTLGSAVILVLLLPGLLFTHGWSVTVPFPSAVPFVGGSTVIGVPELIFVGLPAAFVALMIVEATGHVRERRPPS